MQSLVQPPLFHLAFPVTDIAQTKAFYATGLGCQVGRENPHSVILNLYGHQLVAHVTHEPLVPQQGVYPRHFGVVFGREEEWVALLERSRQQGLKFYQSAKHRFVGTPLEHRTFFLEDPFYNLLEFKFYVQPTAIFEEANYAQIGDTL
jgi:uncharacterized protein